MSHSTVANKSKQQRHPKVRVNQYLYNSGEPRDVVSHYLPPELEFELVEDSYLMRRRVRLNAQRLRSQYS